VYRHWEDKRCRFCGGCEDSLRHYLGEGQDPCSAIGRAATQCGVHFRTSSLHQDTGLVATFVAFCSAVVLAAGELQRSGRSGADVNGMLVRSWFERVRRGVRENSRSLRPRASEMDVAEGDLLCLTALVAGQFHVLTSVTPTALRFRDATLRLGRDELASRPREVHIYLEAIWRKPGHGACGIIVLGLQMLPIYCSVHEFVGYAGTNHAATLMGLRHLLEVTLPARRQLLGRRDVLLRCSNARTHHVFKDKHKLADQGKDLRAIQIDVQQLIESWRDEFRRRGACFRFLKADRSPWVGHAKALATRCLEDWTDREWVSCGWVNYGVLDADLIGPFLPMN
jgi:hypothetical protein